MTKYHNRRVTLDGYVFDSQAEAWRWGELVLLERAGEIHDLRVHPSYLLQPGFKVGGKPYQPITFVADFEYVKEGRVIVEDVKKFETPGWKIKCKLFLRKYPELVLRIVKV